MNNEYTFEVRGVGTVRVAAANLGDALIEIAELAGITIISGNEFPRRKPLRIVRPVTAEEINQR